MQMLSDLKYKEEQLLKELSRIRNKIDAEAIKIELPSLKKKYEGKYFKYRNSYGRPEDGWWLYSHCIEVKDTHSCIANQFEVTTEQCQFRINHIYTYFISLQIEITKKEYDLAAKRIINSAQKLLQ